MGSPIKIISKPGNSESVEFNAVLTSRSGDLQLEFGGALYTVSAHVLIPVSLGVVPKVSQQIVSGDEKFFIASVVRSVID